MDVRNILPIAQGILKEAEALSQLCNTLDSSNPDNGSAHPLWDHPPPESNLARSQTKLLGLVHKLNRLVRGPQDFLQELVASNWEQGSLYCLLDNGVLEHFPQEGSISVAQLAAKSSIPEDKLLPMLRLAVCDQIIEKDREENFRHGLMSRELVNDPGLKAFIEFQLYETRVASAHLSNSVKRVNPTWTGRSAFEYAWGEPMEIWHERHSDKGFRFAAAMKKVTATLDPGNKLLEEWFTNNIHRGGASPKALFDITWSGTPSADFLQEKFPYLIFYQKQLFHHTLNYTQVQQKDPFQPSVYLLKSVLWHCPDQDCINILRHLSHLVALNHRSLILINDLVSPEPGAFEPHVEKAYRRRDVTVMTMHNAKLRTATEWESIFRRSNPDLIVKRDGIRFTSHSCRGQWELRLP